MKTPKERLEELKATEVQTTLGDLNEPIAFYNGFNAGVDACLPLLEEVDTRLHAYMDFVDDMATGHIFSTAFENLEKALTPPTK